MDAEKDEEVAKWHKLGPVDSDRLTQPWKYGFVWVPFFITTSPLHASKWVVNRYFDNCEPLVNRYCQQVEKGAGNAMEDSHVMLVRFAEETPTTFVQVHRNAFPFMFVNAF